MRHPREPARPKPGRVLGRLVQLMLPFRGEMALAWLLGVATVGSGIGLAATSAWLISTAALGPSIADLGVAIVGVRFFGIARGSLRYLERYVTHSVTFRILARLRVWFYQALEPWAPAGLLAHKGGDLLSRAVADIDTLQDFYLRVGMPIAVASVVSLGLAVWLWHYGSVLAVIFLLFAGLTGLGIPISVRSYSREAASRQAAQRAALRAVLVDSLQGAAEIVAYGQEAYWAAQLRSVGESLGTTQKRLAEAASLQTGLGQFLSQTAMLLVLIGAAAGVNAGKISGTDLAMVALATLAGFEALLPVPAAIQALEGCLTAMRRLLEFEEPPLPSAGQDQPVLPEAVPANSSEFFLEVRDLRFAYAANLAPALDGIRFALRPGQRVAIVGPSGAGKSTLVNLLLRFWEYDEGQIWLGGAELRTWQPEAVRRQMAVVSPGTYLFNATLRENLLLANPEASEADLARVLGQAQLAEFVRALPQGVNTWIGERGLSLSGGERQRLAFARTLLQEAPLLIWDEPTANLDPLTERRVLQDMLAALQRRSLLLITHRLVGLDAMDEILVLDQGRVVERGGEADLLGQRGLYWRLWKLQNRAHLPEARSSPSD